MLGARVGISEEANGLHPARRCPLGQNIRDYLKLDDTLFTLKLTPNPGALLECAGHCARGLGSDRCAP